MEKSIKLGAIDKEEGKYINISYAKKSHKYRCPECEKDVILRKGEKNRKHFAHKRESGCEYYEHPSESQIHKDGKMLIKMLFEKNQLDIYKECIECNEKSKIKMPEYIESNSVELEYSFKYDMYNKRISDKGILKIADIAYLNEERIIWICEILNSHKTEEGDRPEPWNEIDAKELLKKDIKEDEKVEIKCNRKHTCEKCYEERYKRLDLLDLKNLLKSVYLEWFIRYKLGQRNFNNEKYVEHLRIDYDSMSNNEEVNERILYLFKKYYKNKYVLLKTTKGLVYVRFINIYENNDEEINKTAEQEEIIANPNKVFINLTGCGTIEIIRYILENIQKEYITINKNSRIEYYRKVINERIYLLVDYEEKNKIKKMGGLWDGELKKWYIKKINENIIKILKKFETIKICISTDV